MGIFNWILSPIRARHEKKQKVLHNREVLARVFNDAINNPLITSLAKDTGGKIGETELLTAIEYTVSARGEISRSGKGRPIIIVALILLCGVVLRNRTGLHGGSPQQLWLIYNNIKQPCPWISEKGINTITFLDEEIKAARIDNQQLAGMTEEKLDEYIDALDIVTVPISIIPTNSIRGTRKNKERSALLLDISSRISMALCRYTLNVSVTELQQRISLAESLYL